jgi:DNA invertase Pin-like site-specific DNA recombinase
MQEFCKRRGWTLIEYVDVGISGTKEKRPALDRLMADAHKRKFDVVVAWKFDRFARSVSHLLRALETFQALGIEFVSLTEGVDTSTPTGRMVFTVLGAVAELERSLIVERVKAGLRNARAKGKKLGRPKVILDVSKIAKLRAQGIGWKKISRELGVGSVPCSESPKKRARVVRKTRTRRVSEPVLGRLVSIRRAGVPSPQLTSLKFLREHLFGTKDDNVPATLLYRVFSFPFVQ